MRFIISVLFSVLLFQTFPANGQSLRKKQFNLDKSGLAIEGYDPVAYFTTGKPVEGGKAFSYVYGDVTYRFANDRNRQLFIAKPASYEPQYGGWCAYAMGSTGEKVEIDPETFKITGGRLYLFYNRFFNNTLKTWNKSESTLKASADQSWTKFYH